jgi:hypothetical protein
MADPGKSSGCKTLNQERPGNRNMQALDFSDPKVCTAGLRDASAAAPYRQRSAL